MTAKLGRSTVYKVLFLCAFWPCLGYLPQNISGVAIAIFLLLAAELCEASYLRSQRSQLIDDNGLVPVRPLNVK
ncbi:MAG: hypothetical protein JRE63_08575 [Deltaproteobacteria bacterium]|nr:hypothetical protein [Deltaproteobacteria bacterium]